MYNMNMNENFSSIYTAYVINYFYCMLNKLPQTSVLFNYRWQASINISYQDIPRPCHSSGTRSLPMMVAWIWFQVKSCGICGGQNGTGAGVLQVLQFPCHWFIPLISPQSSLSIIQGWYNRPINGCSTTSTSFYSSQINKKWKGIPTHFNDPKLVFLGTNIHMKFFPQKKPLSYEFVHLFLTYRGTL
jgi:hypothetical protein